MPKPETIIHREQSGEQNYLFIAPPLSDQERSHLLGRTSLEDTHVGHIEHGELGPVTSITLSAPDCLANLTLKHEIANHIMLSRVQTTVISTSGFSG
jgi:hypothetical protein